MPIAEDKIRETLKAVVDPELFVNIVDLGLIYDVKVDEQTDGKSNVAVEMTMTSPACPAGPQLLSQSHEAVQRLDGVGQVDVKLVMEPPWTPDRMTEDAPTSWGSFDEAVGYRLSAVSQTINPSSGRKPTADSR